MECFRPGVIAPHNAITGGYGLDCTRIAAGGVENLDMNVFHRFGMLWDETGYTFYIDGEENGRITRYISRRPEFILLTTEVYGYRFETHQAVKRVFDIIGKDVFIVDHVRVFDAVKE